MSEETCWLCLRTSPKRVLEVSHKLFPYSPKLAHTVGMKAAELLRKAYFKNPPTLCGKKTSVLIAGALYVAALLKKEWVTRREVAEACDITEASVRTSYRRLIKVLELEDELLIKHTPYPSPYGFHERRKPYYYPKIPWSVAIAKKEGSTEHSDQG